MYTKEFIDDSDTIWGNLEDADIDTQLEVVTPKQRPKQANLYEVGRGGGTGYSTMFSSPLYAPPMDQYINGGQNYVYTNKHNGTMLYQMPNPHDNPGLVAMGEVGRKPGYYESFDVGKMGQYDAFGKGRGNYFDNDYQSKQVTKLSDKYRDYEGFVPFKENESKHYSSGSTYKHGRLTDFGDSQNMAGFAMEPREGYSRGSWRRPRLPGGSRSRTIIGKGIRSDHPLLPRLLRANRFFQNHPDLEAAHIYMIEGRDDDANELISNLLEKIKDKYSDMPTKEQVEDAV